MFSMSAISRSDCPVGASRTTIGNPLQTSFLRGPPASLARNDLKAITNPLHDDRLGSRRSI